MNRPHPLSLRPSLSITRFIAIIVLLSFVSATLFAGAAKAETDAAGLQLSAHSAILIDADSGQVMYEKDSDTAYAPASMSKMMTEYLVFKAVEEGKLSWDQTITVTENAASQVGSRIFLAVGDKHTVEQLYIAMAVGSANDASVQLAEAVAGSEEAFAKLMNETAAELGMTNSHFINATGLDRADMPEKYRPTSIEGETMMSARDAATLAYHIIKEDPKFLEYSKIQTYQFRERDTDPIVNYNWMLESNKDVPSFRKFAYEGVDGLKTGHTSSAGNCFTGTALRDGTRLIAVVMGVEGSSTDGKRFLETATLFDYGFNNFEKKTVIDAKTAVPEHETLPVKKGVSKKLDVVTATDLTILVKKGETIEPTVTEVKSAVDPITAPVKQGDKVGTVTYTYKDPATQADKSATIDLVATEDVKKASWWRLMFRAIGEFFAGLFKGIVNLF